jgi:hypothetical protein
MTKSISDGILAALAPREEKLQFNGFDIVVRELPSAADVEGFRDGADADYKWLVRCTFTAKGEPVFTDAQIPALKQTARAKLMPLLTAVFRVNGLLPDEAAKNSEASPAAS